MSTRLPNYVHMHRKRLGLSQDELAFLLGVQSGAKVSRYEHFVRVPNLETVFALEAVFHRPACELFGGMYQEIERKVRLRAKALALSPGNGRRERGRAKRRQALRTIADGITNSSTQS